MQQFVFWSLIVFGVIIGIPIGFAWGMSLGWKEGRESRIDEGSLAPQPLHEIEGYDAGIPLV